MLLGSVLLILALLSLTVAFGWSLHDLRRGGDPGARDLAVRFTWVGLGFIVFALLLLAAAFLVGDLSIHYVWANSDLRYAWYQRLSGLWVGRAGSLLLWTGFTAAAWSLEELRHRLVQRRDERVAAESAETAVGPGSAVDRNGTTEQEVGLRLQRAEKVRRVARAIMLGILGLMVFVVLQYDPFVATDPELQASQPWGRGVNPQLIILLNAIHPPIVFLGYALTAIITAFAVGHLVTGERSWLGPARRWAHLAFLFLTIAVGLGALWAYIALGWGGYWAWDPVEVASVIPWLMVVLFIHAAYRTDTKGEFPVAAPAFGLLAFPAALFSALVVRAGGVWTSLHSFLPPGASTDPWQRFLTAFTGEAEVKLYAGLLALALVALVGLVALQVQRLDRAAPPAPTSKASDRSVPWTTRLLSHVTLSNLFVLGVMLLALLTTVTLTVLFMGINGFPSDRAREQIFTTRTAPIALTMVLVMALAVSIGVLRKTRVLALLGGALLVGIIAAILLRDIPGRSSTLGIDVWPLAMATPVLVVSAVLVAWRIGVAWKTMRRRQAVRLTGVHLVHLGVALLFLGHGFVSTFEHMEQPVEFAPGDTKAIGPYLMRLESLDSSDTDDNGRLDHVVAVFRVWEGGDEIGLVTTGFRYHDFQSHYKPSIGIGKTFGKDVYLAPSAIHDPNQGWLLGNLPLFESGNTEAREVDGFALQVWTLPFIDLVWFGASLMVLGAALLSWSSWNAWRPERLPERQPHGASAALRPGGRTT